MGKTFAKIKLCHTNDFPSPQNEGIKRWVENNGGTCKHEIGADTTHLVCSMKAWKRYHPLVKEARRRNRALSRTKKIKIVKYDWLEDSLTSKSRKPKDTAIYDWEQKRIGHKPAPGTLCILEPEELTLAEKKVEKIDRKMIEFNKEIEEFETTMQTKGYHPYIDSAGFRYLIVLIRRDIEKNLIERHRIKYFRFPAPYPFSAYPVVVARRPKRKFRVPVPNPWAHSLQLFESDTTPQKYACYLSYTAGRPGIKKETQDLAPVGSDWEFAWAMFTKIFKLKTGVDWNERPELSEARDMETRDVSRLQIDGVPARSLKKYFEYMPRKRGLPQGLRYSGGCTEGPAAEIPSTDKEVAQDVRRAIKKSEGRPSVTLMMPGMAAPDDVEASARTPEGSW